RRLKLVLRLGDSMESVIFISPGIRFIAETEISKAGKCFFVDCGAGVESWMKKGVTRQNPTILLGHLHKRANTRRPPAGLPGATSPHRPRPLLVPHKKRPIVGDGRVEPPEKRHAPHGVVGAEIMQTAAIARQAHDAAMWDLARQMGEDRDERVGWQLEQRERVWIRLRDRADLRQGDGWLGVRGEEGWLGFGRESARGGSSCFAGTRRQGRKGWARSRRWGGWKG
ncbi:hypothetical protein BDK51DRAFT_31863, partial [Blyttiomyces helicus]